MVEYIFWENGLKGANLLRRRLTIWWLLIIAAIMVAFMYWVVTAEATDEMLVAPSWDNHEHYLVGFALRFPSEIYSRLVRIEDASYSDQGGRFIQTDSWVYENPDVVATDADESTLSGLRAIDSYAPSGSRSITFLFKLKDNAYVASSDAPLALPTGPYSVTVRYKVLWFERTATFTRTNTPVYP